MKIKMLNKDQMIKNINGLSLGDRAYCGPYGTITCTEAATSSRPRKFKVANSIKLHNGGQWTMSRLRKAING